ncbi:MAG: Ig-like domain repeat protein [Pseudonocardiaceae bacterium]
MPGTTRTVFLSYRREETRHIAGRLADRLTERLESTEIFIDVDAIEPGSDFAVTIARQVASCDVVIALIGPTWSMIADPQGRRRLDDPDDLVVLEIRTALEHGIRIIPVLVDGAVMPDRYDLPQGLQSLALRNAVRLDHETFRTDIVTLLGAIERVLPTLAQKATEPTIGTDDRDRSASKGIVASRRRWIAGLTRPTGVEASAGRLLTEGDGGRWFRSRRLLAGVMAIVLLVSGVVLTIVIGRGAPTDGNTFQPTMTALTVGFPVTEGSGERVLIATITPSATAGFIQFRDGVTDLGNPVTVSEGTAFLRPTLSVGSHQLTALFAPSDPTAFRASTSQPVNVTVTKPTLPPPSLPPSSFTVTATALSMSPASPVAQGSRVILSAAISPAAAVGTVQFKDGTINLGNPVLVSADGTAFGATSTLSVGPHQLTAVFIPSDPQAFGPSTSPVVTFTTGER